MTNLSRKTGKFFLLLSAATLLLVSCTESVAPVYKGSPVKIVETETIENLEETFDIYRYSMDKLHLGVPPIILESFPPELSQLSSAKRKKRLFLKALLPMVLLANNEIAQERTKLLLISEQVQQKQPLDEEQLHLLVTLQQRYSVTGDPTAEKTLATLQRRINLVPAELALAQAANESAWGTSRFSQLGNNLFGEWTFTPGTGIVPEGRPEGATYEVKRFDTLYDSIRSYLRNLNTHAAYTDFRTLRAEAAARGETLNGEILAEGLLQYSTRREDYVLDLQNLIRQNNLERFAQVSLRQG